MGAKIGTASCPRHGVHDAAIHVFYDWKVRYVRPVRKCSVVVFASFSKCRFAWEQNPYCECSCSSPYLTLSCWYNARFPCSLRIASCFLASRSAVSLFRWWSISSLYSADRELQICNISFGMFGQKTPSCGVWPYPAGDVSDNACRSIYRTL